MMTVMTSTEVITTQLWLIITAGLVRQSTRQWSNWSASVTNLRRKIVCSSVRQAALRGRSFELQTPFDESEGLPKPLQVV